MAEKKDIQAAMEWINGGVPQINSAGEGITRPPQGAGSLQEFFDREIAR